MTEPNAAVMSGDYDEWEADDERRKRECVTRGLVIKRPAPNELFVDIDNEAQHKIFLAHTLRLGKLIESYTVWPSPSGRPGRCHASVILNRPLKDDHERVLLQALVGSDPMRELLSYLRLEAGMPDATIFFELGVPT